MNKHRQPLGQHVAGWRRQLPQFLAGEIEGENVYLLMGDDTANC